MDAPDGSGEQVEAGTGNVNIVQRVPSGRQSILIAKYCYLELPRSFEKCLSMATKQFLISNLVCRHISHDTKAHWIMLKPHPQRHFHCE